MDQTFEGSDDGSPSRYRDECTQLCSDSQPFTQTQYSADEIEDYSQQESSLNIWGILRLRGGGRDEHKLSYREVNGIKDSYTIGRNSTANDIVVNDKRVSNIHCRIFCDYNSARLKITIENKSQNGTFINDSLTRLDIGQSTELKSGDEIYLVNPRRALESETASFLFINMRVNMK